jgi:hypothetical protein
MEVLLKMRATGDLSQGTLWEEARKRALFRSKFDPKKESALIEEERQRDIARNMPDPNNPANDDDDEEVPPAAAKA